MHFPDIVFEKTKNQVINTALKSCNSNLFLWASRCLGMIATQSFSTSVIKESLLMLWDLIENRHEDIICWVFSFMGTYCSKAAIPCSELESNDFMYIGKIHNFFNSGISTKISSKIIESALWCMGNLALKKILVKERKIPTYILGYIQSHILSISNGEKIILYACRYISNLISSGGVNKIPLDDYTIEKILCLLQTDNEKIVIWVLCFLGTVSNNAEEYNIKARSQIVSDYIIRQIIWTVGKNNEKYTEAALWALHKMAWSEDNKRIIRNHKEILDLITKFLMKNDVSEKVTQSACLCFGVFFKIGDDFVD
jgi:hypothetical protein